MKKILAFVTSLILLVMVGCGEAKGSSENTVSSVSSTEIQESIETVENGEKITFDDVSLVVPTENWIKYSEKLEEGTVSYQHKDNSEVELAVLFMTLQGIDVEGLTGERALEILEKRVQEEENIEIISIEKQTVQGHLTLSACYNQTEEGDTLEETEKEKNQANVFVVSTDTGIMLVAVLAPETTELYLPDFTKIVESITFA